MWRALRSQLRDVLSRLEPQEPAMNVGSVMARGILTCATDHPVSCAAKIMWENDCGSVPVVDDQGKAIGMITDRDICMAAYTRNLPLSEMTVGSVCSNELIALGEGDSIDTAQRLMQRHRARRLAVTDDGGRPVGLLSLNDLARNVRFGKRRGDIAPDGVVTTLAAICSPGASASPGE